MGRRLTPWAAVLALGLAGMAGCDRAPQAAPEGGQDEADTADAAQTPTRGISPDWQARVGGDGDAIGEPVPEFPVIPTIVVPEILGVQPAQRAFERAMDTAFESIEAVDGIAVTPARCEGDTFVANSGGITRIDESGQVYRNSTEGIFRIDPDGSGYANTGGEIVRVDADGGTYINGVAEADGSRAIVRVEPDGSGYYNGRRGIIRLDGKGEGYWSGPRGIIRIDGDGGGYWAGSGHILRIDADGAGYWNGPHGVIRNDGNGKGYWSRYPQAEVPMPPVPKVPPAGRFPAMQGFSLPGTPCGFIVTLDDRLLFDFDKSDIRPDAAQVLDALSGALGQVQTAALEIRGHTDSKGSDAYNQDLSERRAQSVVAALRQRGVGEHSTAAGFGESQPVAPNEIDGQDNPSGRQLNRRVEIYVRT